MKTLLAWIKTKFKNKKILLNTIGCFIIFLSLIFSHIFAFMSMPDIYKSEVRITTKRDIDNKAMASIVSIITSNDLCNETSKKLKNNQIYHFDGSEISSLEIADGLSSWYLNTNGIFSIYFESQDSSICKIVLDTLINLSTPYIETAMPWLDDKMMVVSFANDPFLKNNNRYQVILGIPIVVGVLEFALFSYFDLYKKPKSEDNNG